MGKNTWKILGIVFISLFVLQGILGVMLLGSYEIEKDLMQEDLYWLCGYSNDLVDYSNGYVYYVYDEDEIDEMLLEEIDCFETFDYTNYS